MRGRAAHDHLGHFDNVQVSCLLLRIVLQDALSEVTIIFPALKPRVFVDDITVLVKGKCRSGGNDEKGDKKAEGRSEEKSLQVVGH